MATWYNTFTLCGRVYGNSIVRINKNNNEYVYFQILVKDDLHKLKKNIVPIISDIYIAEQCKVWCVNGNVVVVKGQVTTSQRYDANECKNYITPFFLAKEIMLIEKNHKRFVNLTEYSHLMSVYCPEEYKAGYVKTPQFYITKKYKPYKRKKRNRKVKGEQDGTN